ncbi:hypothetical protein [Sphingobacterium siyangense]|uniref:hypothetical protein n=1 Tax=Sphingobacterium siyangense TaxID=459529 RepID=UPI0019641500|nr:hypothetical protein [Sphingobacterium siyangense]QRY55887.1 hypothetical protein JVX97_17870 [Sphingobacterium siyangense]
MKRIFSSHLPALFLGMVFIFCLGGCSKETAPVSDNLAKVQVVLGGIDNKEVSTLKASSGSSSTVAKTQVQTIRLDEGMYLQANLTRLDGNEQAGSVAGGSVSLKAGINKTKAVATPVANGIVYRVLVFDDAGNYVDQADYTVGGDMSRQFFVNPHKTYTFICYSLNGSSALAPFTVGAGQNLSDLTASFNIPYTSQVDNDLMYQRIDLPVVPGLNTLDVVFKHKFTELTAKLDGTAFGNITQAEVYFASSYPTVDLKLNTGAIEYTGWSGWVKEVIFPTINTPVIISNPTIIACPADDEYRKIYGGFTIGTIYKSFDIPGLTIIPGERYALNLVIKKDPSQLGNLIWAPGYLKYDGTTNLYSFTSNTGLGDYFPFGQIYPYGDPRVYDRSQANLGDPCLSINDGYLWRTPTKADYETLEVLGPVENRVVNGVSGAWYPTSATTGVFFRAAGYKDNQSTPSNPIWEPTNVWLWSQTSEGYLEEGSSGGMYAFNMLPPNAGNTRETQIERRELNTLPVGSNDFSRFRGSQIRCVRNH